MLVSIANILPSVPEPWGRFQEIVEKQHLVESCPLSSNNLDNHLVADQRDRSGRQLNFGWFFLRYYHCLRSRLE